MKRIGEEPSFFFLKNSIVNDTCDFHCSTETALVQSTKTLFLTVHAAVTPTNVFPAPQGSTIIPLRALEKQRTGSRVKWDFDFLAIPIPMIPYNAASFVRPRCVFEMTRKCIQSTIGNVTTAATITTTITSTTVKVTPQPIPII